MSGVGVRWVCLCVRRAWCVCVSKVGVWDRCVGRVRVCGWVSRARVESARLNCEGEGGCVSARLWSAWLWSW